MSFTNDIVMGHAISVTGCLSFFCSHGILT